MSSGIMQADQSGCSKRNSISGSMKEKMKEIAKGMNPEKAMEHAIKKGASHEALKKMETEILRIISDSDCPPLQKNGICRNCSFFYFCYSRE